jgi:hypothetical protein
VWTPSRRPSRPRRTGRGLLEKANEALGKFCDELAELRKKHKMPDVYTIIHASYIGEDGQEKQFLLPAQMGDALKAEGMTAWAYGYEQAERKARIDDAFSQAMKKSGK